MSVSKCKVSYPDFENQFLSQHVKLLCDSFYAYMGYSFWNSEWQLERIARNIFHAPFVLISHGTQAEPIFNYANLTALKLFAMDWDEFTQLPSKYSAESPNREERARLLAAVEEKGYIENYQGIRIAKNGKRFLIEQAKVWNVSDENGLYAGQAAYFDRWKAI